MSTLPYRNETKTTDLGGTHTIRDKSLPNFNIHRWHCGPCYLWLFWYYAFNQRGGATFVCYWETKYELCLDQQSCVPSGTHVWILKHIKLPHQLVLGRLIIEKKKYFQHFNWKIGQKFPIILPLIWIITGVTSMSGVIFEDFYMCVSQVYKDKLQDNYSIFNEFLMNYTQIISFK